LVAILVLALFIIRIYSKSILLQKAPSIISKTLSSFHQKTPDGESRLPDTFEDMNVRPVLCAFFHVARLYTKFVDPDPKRRVVNMEVARGFYKKLVDYVEAHPEAKDAVEQEYEISKELVPMMEIKIKSIKSSVVR